MAERTLPPTRNTTGTTTVAYGGLSPIDAYRPLLDRPVIYAESTSATTTSITAITNAYFLQTVVAGCSHSIGGSAGHFQTQVSGTATGKICGLGSWVQMEAASSGYQGSINDVATVITPLNVGVRIPTGTVTLTNNTVIYGIHAQYITAGATATASKVFFGRVNTGAVAPTALFYAESRTSAAYSEATKSTAAGSFPLIVINDAVSNVALYVNLYTA